MRRSFSRTSERWRIWEHETIASTAQTGVGNAELLGWPAPHPDPEPCRPTWDRVELETNAGVVAALGVLDAEQQDELLDLARRAVPT